MRLSLKTAMFAVALGLAGTSVTNAMVIPAPVGDGDGVIVKVAEGCGPGWWRGPGGHCHPFAVGRACPRGYHIGRYGHRCWPN